MLPWYAHGINQKTLDTNGFTAILRNRSDVKFVQNSSILHLGYFLNHSQVLLLTEVVDILKPKFKTSKWSYPFLKKI